MSNNYRTAARQFVDHLQERPHGHSWLKSVRDERELQVYLNSHGDKQEALETFHQYVTRRGRLAYFVAWVQRQQNRPMVYLLGVIGTLLLAIVGFWPLVNAFQSKVFPTHTPTITPTPTRTLIFSPTTTLTPTLTPSPNPSQIVLATQLPTAFPSFSPQYRMQDDNSELAWVPAGSFIAGDREGVGYPDELLHQVYVDGFWIDRQLVTNQQFSKCPEITCGQPDSFISHKRENGYYGVVEFADYPVMEVTWWQAEAFCEWRGGRLPREAEWEKAAGWDPRSGEMQLYPWGDQPPNDTFANYDNVDLDTTIVGSYLEGMSPVGAYDMAGNLWEWVFDWYGPYDLDQQFNPVGPSTGEFKVTRGGSWSNDTLPTYLRVSNRGTNRPENANNETGFRCAFPE